MTSLLSILLILSSCANKEGASYSEPPAPAAEMRLANQSSDELTKQAAEPAAEGSVIERKLIKNGSVSFETTDTGKTKEDISKLCKDFNAYISSENQTTYGERLQFDMTVRIPADRFEEFISKIESVAAKLESKSINTQDVTEEFIDVEARLKTKKELEARYREILKQAKSVSDLVSIEGQISNVRSEIESMEGRLKYLQNQVSLSTLSISYYQQVGGDFGFILKLKSALRGGWDNLMGFTIGIISLWPFVLILILVIFAWKRYRKMKRARISQ